MTIRYFKHPTSSEIIKTYFSCQEICTFCGGRLFCNIGMEHYKEAQPVGSTVYDSLLEAILTHAQEWPSGSTHIHDCSGGIWDTFLFKYLPESMEVIKTNWKHTFFLTPFYRNGNSGNLVRSLTIISQRT